MTSWRSYDRAALDAQYAPSRTAKDVAGDVARYAADTARAKRMYAETVRADVRYGTRERARLDIFPARDVRGASPILVFIHGGFWQKLDKESASFAAPAFVEAGVAYVAVNYTLAPAATLAEIVGEIRAAVAHVRAHAPAFGGDPDRIVVAGHSAGAYLAAASIARGVAPESWDARLGGVRGLLLISGVFELAPIRACYVNDALGLSDADAAALDLTAARPGLDVPVRLVVGSDETAEFRRQSGALAHAWRPHLSDCTLAAVPGRDHFDILFDLARPGTVLHAAALELVAPRVIGGVA